MIKKSVLNQQLTDSNWHSIVRPWRLLG